MRRIRGVTCVFVILMSIAFLYACGSQKEARLDVITDMALDVVTTMEELTETVSVTEKPIESETTIEETTERETTTEQEITIERGTTIEETTEQQTTIEVTVESETSQAKEKRLEVQCILQNPELPSGCEVTSLAIVLKYYGIDVDKCYLSDNYLKKGDPGTVDIYDAFIGEPRSPYAYGCYAPPLVECANAYLQDIQSKMKAYNVSYTEFDDLLPYIDREIPVIIWNTEDVAESTIGKEWTVNGKKVVWLRGQHCLVITGYDKVNNCVYVADPMKGNVKYPLDIFAERYKEMMMQAVVVY